MVSASTCAVSDAGGQDTEPHRHYNNNNNTGGRHSDLSFIAKKKTTTQKVSNSGGHTLCVSRVEVQRCAGTCGRKQTPVPCCCVGQQNLWRVCGGVARGNRKCRGVKLAPQGRGLCGNVDRDRELQPHATKVKE